MSFGNQNNGQQPDVERRIALWNNQKKRGPKDPDFTGTMTINGQEFRVSMWNNTNAKGPQDPAVKGAVTPKSELNRPQNNGYQTPPQGQGFGGQQAPQQGYAPQQQQGFAQPQATPQQPYNNFDDNVPF